MEREKQRIVVYLVWLNYSKSCSETVSVVSGRFVVLFDESLNTKMQKK